MLEYGTESYEEKFSDLQRELKALEEFGYFPGRLRLLDDRVQVRHGQSTHRRCHSTDMSP